MNPKVSIIVPIYNVSKYIERCARSLFEQTFDSIEFIFVNDCSLDNSIEILKSIIIDYPHRGKSVQIIEHSANRGLAAARNTGLYASKGEYIQHIDSDDFIEVDMIELLYNKAIETNADIVTCDFFFDWGKVRKIHKDNYSSNNIEYTKMILSAEILPCIWCKLIKKTLYFDNKIFGEEGINIGEDYYITPKLTYFANKISRVESALYHYNQTNINAYTKTWSLASINNLLSIINGLNDFFISKSDYETYKCSLLQGKLRKKISLLNFSESKYKNLILSNLNISDDIYASTVLSIHEKNIYSFSKINTGIYLYLYLYLYKNALELVQIIKGRR